MIGIVSVVLGALALVDQGVNYTRQEKILDIRPIHATADKHERIPPPQLIGALALVGEVVSLVVGAKQKA